MAQSNDRICDLYCRYGKHESVLCYTFDGIHSDDVALLLEVVQQRFDFIEPGTYEFSIKTQADYTMVNWLKRPTVFDGTASDFQSEQHYQQYIYDLANHCEGYNVQPTRKKINYALTRETASALADQLHLYRQSLRKDNLISSSESVESVLGKSDLKTDLLGYDDELLAGLANCLSSLTPETLGPAEIAEAKMVPVTDNGEKYTAVTKSLETRPAATGGNLQPVVENTVNSEQDDSIWYKIIDLEKHNNINRGSISRAAAKGLIKTNGKNGREKRINVVSFHEWLDSRANRAVKTESTEHVEKLFKNIDR